MTSIIIFLHCLSSFVPFSLALALSRIMHLHVLFSIPTGSLQMSQQMRGKIHQSRHGLTPPPFLLRLHFFNPNPLFEELTPRAARRYEVPRRKPAGTCRVVFVCRLTFAALDFHSPPSPPFPFPSLLTYVLIPFLQLQNAAQKFSQQGQK
jgi:hypothetical protein